MKSLSKKLFRFFTLVLTVFCAAFFVACGQKETTKTNNDNGAGNSGGGSSDGSNSSIEQPIVTPTNTVYQQFVQRQTEFAEELNNLSNSQTSCHFVDSEFLGDYADRIDEVTFVGDNYFALGQNFYIKNNSEIINIVPDRCNFSGDETRVDILEVKNNRVLVSSMKGSYSDGTFTVVDFSNVNDIKVVSTFKDHFFGDAQLFDDYILNSGSVSSFHRIDLHPFERCTGPYTNRNESPSGKCPFSSGSRRSAVCKM